MMQRKFATASSSGTGVAYPVMHCVAPRHETKETKVALTAHQREETREETRAREW